MITNIKRYNEFINENFNNGLQKGDVIEVISVWGEIDVPPPNDKYIGRLFIVDSVEYDKGEIIGVNILPEGAWWIQDVRKLSEKEIEERKPEIDEISNAIIDDWKMKQQS